MIRKPTDIAPLVAARVRPKRRPPLRTPPSGPGASLRISHGPRTDADQLKSPKPATSLSASTPAPLDERGRVLEIRRAAEAFSVADKAIGRISAHLLKLKELNRPASGIHRRSPREAVLIQEQTDYQLRAIDDIVADTTFDGRKMLTGKWFLQVSDSGVEKNAHIGKSVHIDSMETSKLGTAQAGFLSSLATGEANAPIRSQNNMIRVIIESALSQVVENCDRLLAFASQTLEPLLQSIVIAEENAKAAQNVANDGEFALGTSQVTRSDVLAEKANQFSRRQITPKPSPFLLIED